MRILITGGAGFVGSHTADALLRKGYKVRIFDNLDPQVHGKNPEIPNYLNPGVEFYLGDVRDRDSLKQSIMDVDAVFHLAAAVGVGQSMYEISKYIEINSLGGAILLDILANENHQVQKVIVASSMSIYGEGEYLCENCGHVFPQLRQEIQLETKDWEMRCPNCSQQVKPIPTSENKTLQPTSIYAISKRDHEEMFLTVGSAYNIPTVALRYFNIYGSRQALSNPYTGVAAIFCSRLINQKPPFIFEDGKQSRDFIHINDIVQANILALEMEEANYEVFNVGTGRQMTIIKIANVLREILAPKQPLEISGKYRLGDIRHCYADNRKIQTCLGFSPRVEFEEGIEELVHWVTDQESLDLVEEAKAELNERNLVR